jgi:anthranilate synthase component I
MTLLSSALSKYHYVSIPAIPTFTGGAIGYAAYDCIHHFEPSTARTDLSDPLEIPEAVWMLSETLLVFDHLFQTIRVVSHVYCPEDPEQSTLRYIYDRAVANARELAGKLLSSAAPASVPQKPIELGHEAVSNIGKAGYEAFVTKLKEHIVAGDIIQAVPSQRLAKKTTLHPFNAYRRLRQVNPSPYMFFLDLGTHQIVGASPETLCKVEKNRVFNHAIAGTIRRGKNEEEDQELAKVLSGSEKDRAEHIMLVDLARNDVNRVCKPETVQVDHLMRVEKFSHVMHLTSQVSGILREGKTRSVGIICSLFREPTQLPGLMLSGVSSPRGLSRERQRLRPSSSLARSRRSGEEYMRVRSAASTLHQTKWIRVSPSGRWFSRMVWRIFRPAGGSSSTQSRRTNISKR